MRCLRLLTAGRKGADNASYFNYWRLIGNRQMTQQITFLNGEYVPHDQAYVHVEDRGFVFADGVYDFILVHRGFLINEEAHLDRLDYSLGELEIAWPLTIHRSAAQ